MCTNEAHVIVHCHAGISRSASVVIAYIMKYRMKSFKEALDIVRGARSIVEPNIGFTATLIDFEEICTAAKNK